MKTHSYTHTGEKPYKCESCDFSCTQAGNLKTHSYKHTGEKPFKCGSCVYSCTSASDLKKHLYIHTGDRPYNCGSCNYSSITAGDLKRHSYTHTGDKPYRWQTINSSEEHVETNEQNNVYMGYEEMNSEMVKMTDLFKEEIDKLSRQVDSSRNRPNENISASIMKHEETEEIEYNMLPGNVKNCDKTPDHTNVMTNKVDYVGEQLQHPNLQGDVHYVDIDDVDIEDGNQKKTYSHSEELKNIVTAADKNKEKLKHLNIKVDAKIYYTDENSVTRENEYPFKETSICRFVCPKCGGSFLSREYFISHFCK